MVYNATSVDFLHNLNKEERNLSKMQTANNVAMAPVVVVPAPQGALVSYAR